MNAINFSVGNLYKRDRIKPNAKKDKKEFKDEQLKKKSKQSKGKSQGVTLYSALKKDHDKINKEQMI